MAGHFRFLFLIATLVFVLNEAVISKSTDNENGGKGNKNENFIVSKIVANDPDHRARAGKHRPIQDDGKIELHQKLHKKEQLIDKFNPPKQFFSISGKETERPGILTTVETISTTTTLKFSPPSANNVCEFAPSQSQNGHYEVCKHAPWLGCVGRKDGKMHAGCTDVTGYEYDCLRGTKGKLSDELARSTTST